MAVVNVQALEKLKSYCAYQERSHQEVRTKLLSLEVYGDELEEIIGALIEENFLNEERYAAAIVRGKFRYKQWGRIKIKQALKFQKISTYCIQKAMKEIEDDEYQKTLLHLAEKKWESLHSEKNKFTKMAKLRNYLLQKGYETDLIMDTVSHLS
jgi:regulatory protein